MIRRPPKSTLTYTLVSNTTLDRAVYHSNKLSGRIVWMPTFAAVNHIEQHRRDAHFGEKFPTPKKKLLQPTPLRALDDNGALHDELKFILDLIAEGDLVLSAGHLHISEIWQIGRASCRERVCQYV